MSKRMILLYLLYVGAVWSYFYFAYPLVSYDMSKYGAMAHAIFFSKLPLPLFLLVICIKYHWIEHLQAKHKLRHVWVETFVISFMLLFLYTLIQFVFDFIWFTITHHAGTSHQSFLSWIGEKALDFLLLWVIVACLVLTVRYFIIRWPNRWYIMLWLILIPVVILVVYLQPVIIDPLYQDFSELEAGSLKTAIENLTESAGLTDSTVLQVNMSEKVTTFNAYVTGIFSNARIVLWDTTLREMNQNEILFILAHEIGHYVYGHIYIGMIGYLVLALLLLFIAAVMYRQVIYKAFPTYQLYELRAMPILILIIVVLLTVAEPATLFVSRQMETQADQYAITHTNDLDPALASFKQMAIQSKSDVSPLPFVKWIRYSHPPMKERIARIEAMIQQRQINESAPSYEQQLD